MNRACRCLEATGSNRSMVIIVFNVYDFNVKLMSYMLSFLLILLLIIPICILNLFSYSCQHNAHKFQIPGKSQSHWNNCKFELPLLKLSALAATRPSFTALALTLLFCCGNVNTNARWRLTDTEPLITWMTPKTISRLAKNYLLVTPEM